MFSDEFRIFRGFGLCGTFLDHIGGGHARGLKFSIFFIRAVGTPIPLLLAISVRMRSPAHAQTTRDHRVTLGGRGRQGLRGLQFVGMHAAEVEEAQKFPRCAAGAAPAHPESCAVASAFAPGTPLDPPAETLVP